MYATSLENVKPHPVKMLIQQLRPKQWTKNLLVFAALVFSIREVNVDRFIYTALGFVLFCFVSSCVYIVNDYMDLEADRRHPTKRFRPMPSGMLSPNLALAAGALLLLVSLGSAFYYLPLFGLLLSIYFIVNVAYSMKLKHIVIIDVMTIASGFVMRAIGGGILIQVSFTPWFLICTLLLSLFLAIGKRLHEFKLAEEQGTGHRKVLEYYNVELLSHMSGIVTTAMIISYALFTFTSGHTVQLMWTIPLVLYGIFRYQYLIYVENKGGTPDQLLFEDKPILFTVVLYAVSVVIILSIFE
jgi:4-hydroxybenzoate polyprenyltransferase